MFFISNHDNYERNALKYKERSWDAKGRSGLLRGTGPKVSQEELAAQLPPRAIVDILVNRYFRVYASIMRMFPHRLVRTILILNSYRTRTHIS